MTEAQIRYRLKKNGYALVKSRKRKPDFNDEGGYRILHTQIGGVVLGSRFELTLEDVEAWINGEW